MSIAKAMSSIEETVRLVSTDKKVHKVPRSVLKQSQMIEKLIVNLNLEGKFDSQPPITVNVRSDILELVVKWLKKHKNDDTPMIADCEGRTCRKVPKWDRDFFSPLDQSSVYELATAAYHMNIKKLTDLCCKTIASWMTGKDTNQIRTVFGIENDMTEEDLRRADEEDRIAETCTCTSAHPTTKGFELRMHNKLRDMSRELDAMDRISDELMTELSYLKLRASQAQNLPTDIPSDDDSS